MYEKLMARTYRFFIRNMLAEEITLSEVRLSEQNEAEMFSQLTRVLRVKSGDTVILLPRDDSGKEYYFQVESAHKKEILLKRTEIRDNRHELPFDLGLLLCLPNKPDKLSFILQKATELGVSSIELVPSDNSQMKHELRLDRLEKIIIEAAEQSERGKIPALITGKTFQQYLRGLAQGTKEQVFVALERSDRGNIFDLAKKKLPRAVIVIGPEGGFSDDEKKLIHELNLQTFSLGSRVLRMETAVIVSLGLIACH